MFTKPIISGCIIILASLTGLLRVNADEWSSIEEKEFQSSSRKYIFKITPHKDWPDHPGYCKGVLFKADGTKLTEVWSRYLINNVGPVRVFVADSGKYVVTVDEWGEIGEFPVVIYGPQGRLITVHNIKSLGLEDDIEHIKRTVSSFWWSEDAIMFFEPKEDYFFIRLHWGKMLIINLSIGRLYEKIIENEMYNKKLNELQDYAKKKTEEIALSKLNSENPDERKTGALVVGQLKTHSAIPRLRELLHDKEYYESRAGDGPWLKVYYVRKRAKEALEQMGVSVEKVVVEEEMRSR